MEESTNMEPLIENDKPHNEILDKKLQDELNKSEDEHTEDREDDGESCCTKIFWGILYFFNYLKMFTMIGIIGYFWIYTADNRLVMMDVLEELCRHGDLNITFHENRMFGKINDATAKGGETKI